MRPPPGAPGGRGALVLLSAVVLLTAVGAVPGGGPAGATITGVNPSASTLATPGAAAATVSVSPDRPGLTTCVTASGAPPGVTLTVAPSPACRDTPYTARVTATARASAAPGSYPITITEATDSSQTIDTKTWQLTVRAPPPTTTTTLRPTTTAAPATTAVPTTVVAPVTTVEAPTTTSPPPPPPTRRTAVRRAHARSGAVPWLVGGLAVMLLGLLFMRSRSRRRAPAPPTPPPAAAEPLPAPASRAEPVVIPPRAPPPDAAAAPTLVGGLVAPRGSVQLGWGRVLPLRTAASGSAAPVEVTWHLRSVEQIAGRERRPWPEHCPTGGFRARRAVDLGDRATGEQVLLAHPYLGADGDAALVLLDVALRAGSSYASFTAYLRFERVGNDIAVTVADAPAIDAPAASGPEVAGGAGEDDLVLALPDVIATGERLQVRISHPSSEVLDCTWTATAGSFPLGGSGTCVVYEAPAVRGDVIISAGAVVAGGRPALVHRVVRVRKHPVLLVPDLLGTSLEVDGAVVWPPVAGDALTAPAGALRCHADDHVRAQAVLDSASVHGVDVLGGIRRALDRAGHDTFGTPYDWRQAPSAGAHALDAQVRGVLGASEFDRVALVTHGYGGLVARDWLAHLGGEGRADEIVFVATPHRGMPIAYRWLHGGRFAVPTGNPLADLVDAFVAADGPATVASWPALHHLVPPEWNATRPGAADRAADVVAEAEHFHATLPDALPPGLRAVNVYNADQPTEHGYPTGAGSPESETDVTRGDGDGLVPAASARAVGTSLTFAVEMEVSACTHEALAGDGRTADLVVYRLERLT